MVNNERHNYLIILIACILLQYAEGRRLFWKGRRDGGNLVAPQSNISRQLLPPDQWFDQKLDHFNDTNPGQWKQVSSFCRLISSIPFNFSVISFS